MTHAKTSAKIANVFGSFGYFSVIIQWLLFVAIIVFPLLKSSGAERFFMPTGPTRPVNALTIPALPGAVQLGFGIAAVIFCLLAIIYAIYAIPRSVGKSGRRITQASASTLINHLHKSTPLSEEQAAHLTLSVTWTVKIIIILLPLALLFLPLSGDVALARPIVTLLGMFCAGCSLFWFGLQYIVATLAQVEPKNIW